MRLFLCFFILITLSLIGGCGKKAALDPVPEAEYPRPYPYKGYSENWEE